ncbi:transcription initiation factor TFIID subunit 4b-like isoform X2 [Musa acuminata AAA Group]|uniref:transcription initiation factor TFIID subunit 4b-like isoform X2 n=1 Tax=Musa acuminata AAA Group TaxID=214697 RepID=UPI0031D5EE37
MDPSIMKLLEEDEDESMHSGADVEALSAALNRDIGGDPAALARPPESDTGVSMLGSSSASKQVLGQWQTSSEVENEQQIQQKEQKRHLQSSEQHSSGGELIQAGSVSQPQDEQINNQPQHDCPTIQQEASHSDDLQRQPEANLLEKEQVKKPEQNTIQASDIVEGRKQEVAQHSENQQQHLTQQSNSQQIASANIANMAVQHSENQQQHIVQQSNSQQIPTSNQANMAMRRTKAASSIPFHLLIPILRPHLDKDRSMQLQAIFAKLRNNEVSKEDFLRVIRNIVGDQMLRQAAQKVQVQLQAQAARGAQTNTNSFSLQSQASSQQLASSVPPQITGAQSFPALHSIPSSQSLKVTGSPPHQPYVPPLTFQAQPGTGLTAPDNSTQKPREVETKSDGKGAQSVQKYTSNTNITNPERDVSMVSLQPVNKQQHHAQLPQSSFSVSGATSSYNTHAYPRPSMSSSTSIRPQNLDSHARQVSVTPGAVSTQLRPTQSVSVINVPKYEQNPANEAKRQQVGSVTASQHNPIAWQLSANKDQKGNTFPSMAVKQELVDQSSEPPNKSHFASSESTLFGSAHVNQGNHALGSSSTTGTTQISGSVPSQVDQIVQLHSHISSATPPLGGATAKTPSKKPSVGQKKLFEAPGSSPPMPSKKQKTSGTSLDQSIEQLNDVTAVSGVNLREEEEQLLSGLKEESRASEATRRIVQEEEERLLLLKAPLQRKLSDIMLKCGLKNIGGDVERCLSMCVEERLKGLISYLIRLSKQRVDIEKSRHRFVITSDVRRQILLANQKTKEEWDKKQAEESEKLRKVNEMDGNTGVDAEKDKEDGRPKALKANKEEDDKMRATAANVAARAAVGGDDMLSKWQLMAEQARQKREGLDGAPGKTASSKPLLSLGRSSREKQESEKKGSSAVSASGGTRRFGRKNALESHPKVARNVSLKDVIAALEREPQMSKSSLIYRLYERLSSNSSAT